MKVLNNKHRFQKYPSHSLESILVSKLLLFLTKRGFGVTTTGTFIPRRTWNKIISNLRVSPRQNLKEIEKTLEKFGIKMRVNPRGIFLKEI